MTTVGVKGLTQLQNCETLDICVPVISRFSGVDNFPLHMLEVILVPIFRANRLTDAKRPNQNITITKNNIKTYKTTPKNYQNMHK